jgi:protoheme IX farnesyltransferase
MKFRKDYAAANVPMLPVVATPAAVARKILWYSYAMVGATLALIPYAGWIYGVLAAALGAWFLAEAHGLDARVRSAQPPANEPAANQPAEHQPAEKAPSPAPMRLFHLSIAYLTLLFAAVAVTALLPWGRW